MNVVYACKIIGSLIVYPMIRRAIYLLSVFLATQCLADVRVALPDIEPFAYQVGSESRGMEIDLLAALSRQMGQKLVPQVMPLSRVLAYLKKGPDTVGFVVRTPERETSAVWLVSLFDEPFLFVTRKDAASTVNDVEAAKRLMIGVAHDSIGERLAERYGLAHIDMAQTELMNAKKLVAGRIDAWLAGRGAINAAVRKAGLPEDTFHFGDVIVTYQIWIAVSQDMKPEERQAWQDAFEAIRKSGELGRIKSRYGYAP